MKLVPFVLLALITIAGCTLGPNQNQQGYRFINLQVEPIGDRSGLVLLTTESKQIPFFAYVENTMEQPAGNVVVEVGNVNDRIIDIKEQLAAQTIGESGTLAGFENQQGVAHWDDITFDVTVNASNRPYSTELRYHLCADVSTILEETICIAPAQPRGNYAETCEPTMKTITGGQGAPVAIVGIRQADAIDQVSLFFDVVNYGPGLVFSKDLDSCSTIPQEHVGVIELEYVEIGGIPIDCSDSSRMGYELEYQKYEGATLTCILTKSALPVPDDTTTQFAMKAVFTYRYHTEPVKQALIIRKV
jgi:hypothetical protein